MSGMMSTHNSRVKQNGIPANSPGTRITIAKGEYADPSRLAEMAAEKARDGQSGTPLRLTRLENRSVPKELHRTSGGPSAMTVYHLSPMGPMARIEKEIEEKQQRLKILEQETEQRERERQQLREKVTQLEKQNARIEAEKDIKHLKVVELQRLLSQREAERQDLERKVTHLEEQKARIEGEMEGKEGRLRRMEEEITQRQREKLELREKVTSLQRQNAQATEGHQVKDKRLTELEAEISSREFESQQLKVKVSSLEQLSERLEEEKGEKQRKLRALQDEVALREEERRALTQRVVLLERQAVAMETERQDTEEKLQKLQKKRASREAPAVDKERKQKMKESEKGRKRKERKEKGAQKIREEEADSLTEGGNKNADSGLPMQAGTEYSADVQARLTKLQQLEWAAAQRQAEGEELRRRVEELERQNEEISREKTAKARRLTELQYAVVRREAENYELRQRLAQLESIKDTILDQMLQRERQLRQLQEEVMAARGQPERAVTGPQLQQPQRPEIGDPKPETRNPSLQDEELAMQTLRQALEVHVSLCSANDDTVKTHMFDKLLYEPHLPVELDASAQGHSNRAGRQNSLSTLAVSSQDMHGNNAEERLYSYPIAGQSTTNHFAQPRLLSDQENSTLKTQKADTRQPAVGDNSEKRLSAPQSLLSPSLLQGSTPQYLRHGLQTREEEVQERNVFLPAEHSVEEDQQGKLPEPPPSCQATPHPTLPAALAASQSQNEPSTADSQTGQPQTLSAQEAYNTGDGENNTTESAEEKKKQTEENLPKLINTEEKRAESLEINISEDSSMHCELPSNKAVPADSMSDDIDGCASPYAEKALPPHGTSPQSTSALPAPSDVIDGQTQTLSQTFPDFNQKETTQYDNAENPLSITQACFEENPEDIVEVKKEADKISIIESNENLLVTEDEIIKTKLKLEEIERDMVEKKAEREFLRKSVEDLLSMMETADDDETEVQGDESSDFKNKRRQSDAYDTDTSDMSDEFFLEIDPHEFHGGMRDRDSVTPSPHEAGPHPGSLGAAESGREAASDRRQDGDDQPGDAEDENLARSPSPRDLAKTRQQLQELEREVLNSKMESDRIRRTMEDLELQKVMAVEEKKLTKQKLDELQRSEQQLKQQLSLLQLRQATRGHHDDESNDDDDDDDDASFTEVELQQMNDIEEKILSEAIVY